MSHAPLTGCLSLVYPLPMQHCLIRVRIPGEGFRWNPIFVKTYGNDQKDSQNDRHLKINTAESLPSWFTNAEMMVISIKSKGQSQLDWEETRPLSRIYLAPKEQLSIISRWRSKFHPRYVISNFCEANIRIFSTSQADTVMTLHANVANYL